MTATIEFSTVTEFLQKQEVFENETVLYSTHEVDSTYRAVVDEMAMAIYQHDRGMDEVFPTGDEAVDSPYRCRADDALRAALPLLRRKFADELVEMLKSPEELQRERDAARFAGWVREATETAMKKPNSAHPRNRRVRTGGPSSGAEFPPLWRYVRGTCVLIGSVEVAL